MESSVTPRFVPSEGPRRIVETQLASLDSFLQTLAGPDATVATEDQGTPARIVQVDRPDGVTICLSICPLTLPETSSAPLRFIVAARAWAVVSGLRTAWRHGGDVTISLASAGERRSAETAITRAWEEVRAVALSDILGDGGGDRALARPR